MIWSHACALVRLDFAVVMEKNLYNLRVIFVSKCHVIMAVITLETLASAAITPPITLLR